MNTVTSYLLGATWIILSQGAFSETQNRKTGPVNYEDVIAKYSGLISTELQTSAPKPEERGESGPSIEDQTIIRLTAEDLRRPPTPHQERRKIVESVLNSPANAPQRTEAKENSQDLTAILEEVEQVLKEQPTSERKVQPAPASEWARDLAFMDRVNSQQSASGNRAEEPQGPYQDGYQPLMASPQSSLKEFVTDTLNAEKSNWVAVEEEAPLLRPKRRLKGAGRKFRYDTLARGSTRLAREVQSLRRGNREILVDPIPSKGRGKNARHHSASADGESAHEAQTLD